VQLARRVEEAEGRIYVSHLTSAEKRWPTSSTTLMYSKPPSSMAEKQVAISTSPGATAGAGTAAGTSQNQRPTASTQAEQTIGSHRAGPRDKTSDDAAHGRSHISAESLRLPKPKYSASMKRRVLGVTPKEPLLPHAIHLQTPPGTAVLAGVYPGFPRAGAGNPVGMIEEA
jgi:hypothetical protein